MLFWFEQIVNFRVRGLIVRTLTQRPTRALCIASKKPLSRSGRTNHFGDCVTGHRVRRFAARSLQRTQGIRRAHGLSSRRMKRTRVIQRAVVLRSCGLQGSGRVCDGFEVRLRWRSQVEQPRELNSPKKQRTWLWARSGSVIASEVSAYCRLHALSFSPPAGHDAEIAQLLSVGARGGWVRHAANLSGQSLSKC